MFLQPFLPAGFSPASDTTIVFNPWIYELNGYFKLLKLVFLYRRGFDLKESLWSGSLTFQQAVSTAATNLDGEAFVSVLVINQPSACLVLTSILMFG
jgi:hypothetical protein